MKYHIVQVTSFNQNCSIIWCEKSNDAMIVDPGGDTEKLYHMIDILKVKIRKIVLTHGHIDHVGSALELKEFYGVPILGPSKEDRFLLLDINLQYKILGINEKILNHMVIPDIWLKDGDTVRIGFEIFSVLHCPGHSPGHIVLWNKLRKFIIMGDVLFKNNVGRSDLPGGDYDILIKSIKTKLFILEEDIVFLPGHGSISTIGYERKFNPFLN